jgi:hypothetical protein
MHASDPRRFGTWFLAESHPADRAKPCCQLGLFPDASNGAIDRLFDREFPGLIDQSASLGFLVAHVQLHFLPMPVDCKLCVRTRISFCSSDAVCRNTYPYLSCC